MIKPEIAICIITYRRFDNLKLCINSIASQKTKFKYDIIIVDNDCESRIKKAIDEIAQAKQLSIKYYIENTKGIPNARNKCVEIARDSYKYLIFIDDDEEALDNWLESLVKSIKELNSDIVIGPVISEFTKKPSNFINIEDFFNRKRYPTGTILKNGRTGNMIANTTIFKNYEKPFETSFNKMGGSDSHFFKKIHKDGFITKWDNEAIVKEIIPKQRAKISWIIKRMLRVGASNAYSDLLEKKYKKISIKVLESILKLSLSIFVLPLALTLEIIKKKSVFIKYLARIFRVTGYLLGIINIQVHDYK
tara:strand:- start:984 stop:1901 length:918 start_codon:yes stop_codon:yes gene_type:complete